ncbi:S-layer homology domain-containing protein [Paenibacillus sp. S-38]|uniref:S-layer homology domain-containing protein n=1 Tax=Paenibacillus sp. S-38 TaxID=3416710 RepID=UPI003CF22A8F
MKDQRGLKRIGMLLLSWCLMVSMLGGLLPVYADAAARGQVALPAAVDEAAGYIMALNGGAPTDWDAYALAKAGKPVPASYLESVSAELQKSGGVYSNVTDYARIALGVKAAGGSPEAVTAGSVSYNLIQSIYNSERMTAQGTNGAIYSLLALSSGTYDIPLTAQWNPDKIAAWLLTQQNGDGGWPLAAGGAGNIDITASAIFALSPYKSLTGVQPAIDKGVQWLSGRQLANGGFTEYGENAESTAQVILALSAAGVDARGGSFTKAEGNPLSYLFGYRQSDGGFAHVAGGPSNAGATGQAIMALAAYHAFTGGNSGTYDAVLTTGSTAPQAADVTVHVAGPAGILAEGPASAATAYEAAAQLLQSSGIPWQEGAGHFITSVGSTANDNNAYTYWLYNVKRQGAWDFAGTSSLGLADYSLRNGDEVYLYYGGMDTTLVKSITVEPALPVTGQALQVKVEQTAWDWNAGTENVSVASAVYVELGGLQVQADSQGIARFASGLPGGTYKAVVTGYREGTAPRIVTDSKMLEVGSADVQIEGSTGTYAAGTAASPNLLDSIQALLTDKGVPFRIESSSFGRYVKSVGSDADAWNYAVYRQGKWNIPQVGMADYTLQPGDRAVIYYGGYDASWNPTTYLVESVKLNPAQPRANQSFTVTVNKTLGYDTPAPAAGIQLKIGSLTATTNSEGTATFAGLAAGTYTLDISGYVTGAAPRIVHTTQTVTVLPRTGAGGGGGGTGSSGSPYVYLSVAGDEGKGTIVSSTQVSLQSGDTPYSVLIRQLGADRVKSSGSGSTAYVQGIDGLYEFDRGPLSGWMYAVNGTYLSSGADSVTLKSGDTVAWRYTLDGGKDLNAGGSSAGPAVTGAAGAQANALKTVSEELGLAYDNRKPVHEVAKPAIVLNADKKMTATAAAVLQEVLVANTVNVQKSAAPDSAAILTDDKAEIQLHIPAGALKETATLTVKELPAGGRSGLVSPMYEFGPAGQTFEQPVQITVKTPVASVNLDALSLAWLNEQTGEWIPIPAVLDAETGKMTGLVNHFTKFAVIDKSAVETAGAVEAPAAVEVGPAITRAAAWLKNGAELSDWSAYALSRAGVSVPSGYLAEAEALLREKNGTFRNVTDYERLALSVRAAGGDPQSIGGFDLIERIYNNERMETQGTNGPIYALLALNAGDTEIPADAAWTKERLLQWILDAQNADGSWPLVKGETGSTDLTGSALAALSYYETQAEVKAAVSKAVQWLGTQQAENGGFALDGVVNAESTAQVLWGLSVSGIDPVHSASFQSGDSHMVNYLLGLQLDGGAFPHVSGGEAEGMATEQAVMALGAYQAAFSKSVGQQAPEVAPGYSDMEEISPWALSYVKKAAEYGIMEGTGGTVPAFEPKKQVTRAQFVAMLLRLLGEAPSTEGAARFADVASDSWYAGYVAQAVSKGIAEGISEERFAPDASISRQEMAIMLARALKLPPHDAGSAAFTDLGEAYPGAASFIGAVQKNGLMEGDESGWFWPQDPATREMAAIVAVRAYELTKHP